MPILLIVFRATSPALGQAELYDYPSATEAILKDMSKVDQSQYNNHEEYRWMHRTTPLTRRVLFSDGAYTYIYILCHLPISIWHK